MNLLDANVWLAGMWDGHSDHDRARRWRADAEGACAMCRVTQMAVLRHLSNPAVMGLASRTRRDAWALVMRQLDDPGVVWLDEPPGLEDEWHRLSAKSERDHKLWTDDYLAAFATLAGARLITMDHALGKRYPGLEVVTV